MIETVFSKSQITQNMQFLLKHAMTDQDKNIILWREFMDSGLLLYVRVLFITVIYYEHMLSV